MEYAEDIILNGSSRGLENRLYVQECLMKLYKSMGARVRGIRLLYWPVKLKELRSQNLNRKPQRIFSGFMSRHRGLHWQRT
jgi:hypothetical protein